MKPADFRFIRKGMFRGRSYGIIWRKIRETALDKRRKSYCDGYCDNPKTPGKKICLNPKRPAIMLLDSALHETLHACIPELDEESVGETINAQMRLLIRMGIQVSFDPNRPLKEKTGEWKPCDPYFFGA